VPTVAALNVAPVKALGLTHPDQVRLDVDGVAEDRRLFLLRPDGSVATMRDHPTLTAVVPDLDLAAGKITVTLPDGVSVTSALDVTGDTVTARLFGKQRTGGVVPGEVADALSAYVGERLRLVLADRTGVGWDEGPVSLLARASAAAVGTPAAPGEPTRRYRMLVEVDGADAFSEDDWVGRRLEVGTATLRVTHALGRCVVVNHDPDRGTKDWAGLHAITRLRPDVTLGVIADVDRPGVVRVGDELVVG
jgi:uncharacterized protein YcbX